MFLWSSSVSCRLYLRTLSRVLLPEITRNITLVLLIEQDINLACASIMYEKHSQPYTGHRHERLRLECELVAKCVIICSQLPEMVQRCKCNGQLAGFKPTDYAEKLDRITAQLQEISRSIDDEWINTVAQTRRGQNKSENELIEEDVGQECDHHDCIFENVDVASDSKQTFGFMAAGKLIIRNVSVGNRSVQQIGQTTSENGSHGHDARDSVSKGDIARR